MSYRQPFCYYSISMSSTMRDSFQTMFWTSCKQHIMLSTFPSLVSTDTSTFHGIRNQSYSSSRKLSSCIVTWSTRHLENCMKLWNMHDRIELMKPLGNCWARLSKRVKLVKHSALLHTACESRYLHPILSSTVKRHSTWCGLRLKQCYMSFVIRQASLYIRFPMKMRVDQGSSFTSVRRTNRAKAVGTDVQESGVEAHNSLRSGEIYHALLSWILPKIREENLKMDNSIRLKLAVKATNDTMGPEGLVVLYLVFGGIPRFPSMDSALPTQQQRKDAMQAARHEMSIITVELRIPKGPLIRRYKKRRPRD